MQTNESSYAEYNQGGISFNTFLMMTSVSVSGELWRKMLGILASSLLMAVGWNSRFVVDVV